MKNSDPSITKPSTKKATSKSAPNKKSPTSEPANKQALAEWEAEGGSTAHAVAATPAARETDAGAAASKKATSSKSSTRDDAASRAAATSRSPDISSRATPSPASTPTPPAASASAPARTFRPLENLAAALRPNAGLGSMGSPSFLQGMPPTLASAAMQKPDLTSLASGAAPDQARQRGLEARANSDRIKRSGMENRTFGHVSAKGKRVQARRDAKG